MPARKVPVPHSFWTIEKQLLVNTNSSALVGISNSDSIEHKGSFIEGWFFQRKMTMPIKQNTPEEDENSKVENGEKKI